MKILLEKNPLKKLKKCVYFIDIGPKTGGEKHCQVGEIQLAEREIVKFLKTVYNIK